jgi:hypothetical protein
VRTDFFVEGWGLCEARFENSPLWSSRKDKDREKNGIVGFFFMVSLSVCGNGFCWVEDIVFFSIFGRFFIYVGKNRYLCTIF